MNKSCPISNKQVDTNTVRINAFLVAILAITFLVSLNSMFAILLAIDFFIRIFINPKFSYMLLVAKSIKKIFNISTIKTDAAPKQFASYFGLFFSVSIVLLSFIGFTKIAIVMAIVLIICALLEAIFNYCLGCQIYHILQSIRKS